MHKVYKYKLDFYYQQSLSYLLVFLIYAGIRGSYFEDRFTLVFSDPIVYIMILFVALSLATLIVRSNSQTSSGCISAARCSSRQRGDFSLLSSK